MFPLFVYIQQLLILEYSSLPYSDLSDLLIPSLLHCMLFLPMLTWLATLVSSPFLQHATFFSASSRPLQLLITLQGGHFSESGSFLSFRDLCPKLLSQRNCSAASYSVFHYQLFPFIGHCSFLWQHLSHEVDPSFIDLFLPLSWVKVQWKIGIFWLFTITE